MSELVKYTNWAVDESGNVVASAQVAVASALHDGTVTIYSSDAGASLANPFTAGADGYFEFWAEPGVYDVTVGTAPSAATTRWNAGAIRLTPQHFGAKADGVTDDTAAFQAAVDGAGGELFVPAGTYIIADPGIQIPDGIRIYGEGKTKSILRKKDNTGATDQLFPIFRESTSGSTFLQADDITLEGLGFVGNAQTGIQTDSAAGLVRFYSSSSLRIVACSFSYGRGYGVGLQGQGLTAGDGKDGPNVDLYMEDCDFFENGLASYLTGSGSDDGLDCKSLRRASLIGCRAWNNGDKGFDLRAQQVSVVACHSYDNAADGFTSRLEAVASGATETDPASASFVSCWAHGNAASGFVVSPAIESSVTAPVQTTTLTGCHAFDNGNNFATSAAGSGLVAADSRVVFEGCASRSPKTSGRGFAGSGPVTSLTFSGCSFFGGDSYGILVNSAQVGPVNICGCTFESMGDVAIFGSRDTDNRMNVSGCVFRDVTGAAISAVSNATISGNTYESVSSTTPVAASGDNNRILDKHQGQRTVASASSVTLPEITDLIFISGSTTITAIAASWAQRTVVLRFPGVITVQDGGNLILAGDFSATSNDTLTLMCDGTNWYELARSVN